MKRILLASLLSLGLLCTAQAAVISVNFAGGNSSSSTGGGDGQALVGAGTAGAVPVANWNDAVGTGGGGGFSPLALVDDMGAAIGASVSWSTSNTWTTSGPTGTPDQNLMKGYLDNFGGQSFNVTGLSPAFTDNGYSVYVYFGVDQIAQMGFTANDGVNSDTRFGRQSGGNGANYPLVGPNGYIVSTDPVNNFATATPSNVILLQGLTESNFTLTGVNGIGVSGSGNRARPNGFQIVSNTTAVPEPATAVLVLLGAGGLMCRRAA